MKTNTRTLLLLLCLVIVGISFLTTRLFKSVEHELPENHAESPAIEAPAESLSSSPDQAVAVSDPQPAIDRKTASAADPLQPLREMLRSEDFSGVEMAVANLAARFGGAENFDELMTYFRNESDPDVLTYLAQILASQFPSAGAEIQAEILAMAQVDPLPAKRAAALSLLATLKDPPPEMLATVAELSREDLSTSVRLNAIYTMSHWADNPARWDEVSSELVKTIDASDEPEIRGNAIQVIALRGGAGTDAVLAAMVDYLENDPTPMNRGIAALALGEAPSELREAALFHLEGAFTNEPDLDIRRNIMTHIARAGEEAIPILLQLKTDHPLLEQDVIDYVEILQSGDIDPDEIYQHKFALDAERDTIVGSATHTD